MVFCPEHEIRNRQAHRVNAVRSNFSKIRFLRYRYPCVFSSADAAFLPEPYGLARPRPPRSFPRTKTAASIFQNKPVAKIYANDFFRSSDIALPPASVLTENLLLRNRLVAAQCLAVQIGSMHVYCADLVVVIGCIIVNPFGSVAAGRVNRDLILSLRHLAAASSADQPSPECGKTG